MLTTLLFNIASTALQLIPGISPPQEILHKSNISKQRPLTGKFLHITDAHPDPFYRVYSSTDAESSCHRDKGPAGYYGAETSDCDSPTALIDATFDWIRENLRDEVDFVIWTGDSARHDNDEQHPRSSKEVMDLNELLVTKLLEAFGKTGDFDDDDPTEDFIIPIVPTLGNNDILPHNIFESGPNYWTDRYLDLWRGFIPEHQRHQFQRGGWFSVEVIPGQLEIFSLNTLYFFQSNGAVDGCAQKDEPGYEQFEWLRIQLQLARNKGVKVILMGHVAPARTDAKTSWTESCWQKYALWVHQYRDIIVAGLYGHMNIDHFMLQDWEDVKGHVRKGKEYDSDDDEISSEEEEMNINSAQDYLESLRDTFAKVPKVVIQDEGVEEFKKPKKPKKPKWDDIGGEFGERYSVTLVSPSLVPNYFPTLRVFSYNISGLEDDSSQSSRLELRSLEGIDEEDDFDIAKKKKHHKKKKPKARKFTVPKGPSKSSPPGPAYSPQSLSLISFTQLYANLTYLNNDYVPESKSDLDAGRWKPGKHSGKKPPNKHQPTPKNLTFNVEYDTATDKVYSLSDLTVRSWLNLAASIGNEKTKSKKRDKTWKIFLQRAFVGTFTIEELEDRFDL
jgi:endopolyphosphatase